MHDTPAVTFTPEEPDKILNILSDSLCLKPLVEVVGGFFPPVVMAQQQLITIPTKPLR